MRTIWKFPLEFAADGMIAELKMPIGAEVIYVGWQERVPMLPTIWAIVDTDRRLESRAFEVHGTGHDVYTLNERHYVGSAVCGQFVWHVFEPSIGEQVWR